MKSMHQVFRAATCKRFSIAAGILAILLASANGARATVLSFAGDLQSDATFLPPGPSFTDGDYAQWAAVVTPFNVAVTSAMEAITFSYGGGTNGNGTVIAEGGFEPYLSLFDASGNFLASTYFGTTCPAGANTNSLSGFCYDVGLDGGTLAPGDYQIAISAFENLSLAENYGSGTLADGFTGLGNLYPGEDLHYAFDVILTSGSPVPEPNSALPIAGLLLGLAWLKRRRVSSLA
jgi:hypothetical protein